MGILVIDVGTSSVRVAVVDPDATLVLEKRKEVLPSTPSAGLVELDAVELASVVLELAEAAIAEHGPVAAVGIANQRASTIVWDRSTGEPVGPGIGWQDLRTVGDCLVLQGDGFRLAPNQSATKLVHLLDAHDPDRTRDLCFGTVDSWVAWTLSKGEVHVTDSSNAGVTGLVLPDGSGWDLQLVERLRIPASALPTIVDSTGRAGEATALAGSPPICGIAGDQQSSLVGQGVVAPGPAKITFGTGAMLDLVVGADRPAFPTLGDAGTFPLVAWSREGSITWGIEAVMLSAGTNVEWLRDDLGIISELADSDAVAASCETTDGVVYVPALLGLGTPRWDYGARGTLLGVTRGTGRAEVVRAVLEGVAQRGVDMIEAAETDSGMSIPTLRIDGGMSRNDTFVQALADASERPVEVSPVTEATALGAAFLAGLEVGTWGSLDDIAATWRPVRRVEPRADHRFDRDRWATAVERAARWEPDLSSISF